MHQLLLELRAVLQPTILLVTHDHQEAVLLADSVAILIDGQVHQHGTASELYARPASLTVSRFLGCLNEIPGELVSGHHSSALGLIPVSPMPRHDDGPAVLVIRQESVRLVDRSVATVVARVERAVPLGARSLVEVATAAGPLFAEAQPGQAVRAGDVVGLLLAPEQCVLLPGQAGAVTLSPTAAPVDVAAGP